MPASDFKVEDAKREAAPVTAAFIGQSGSGKTLSALLFARGLVGPDGKIVMIDTEGKRALIYADDPEVGGFRHIDFSMPYSSERYKDAVMAAVMDNADAIIIDSASHEHEAEGGMLDFADKEEARIGGKSKSRNKWIKPKMAHNRFVRYAVGCPAHVIFCIREKCIADMSPEAQNKPMEKRVLYEPVCEKNLLFEMTIALRLEPGTHKAKFIKVPKPFEAHISDGQVITVEHGHNLLQVSNKGEAFDKEFEKQKAICGDVASFGTEALKAHWGKLPVEMKAKLKSFMDSKFKPIAEQADRDEAVLNSGTEREPGEEG